MNYIGAIVVFALFLLSLFLFVNWGAMTSPTKLSFLFFDAEGSFGLIFLGVTLVFALLFVAYSFALRTSMLLEGHRQAQQLEAQRKLAESAETSRFEKLREQISAEFERLRAENNNDHAGLMTRNEEMEQSLRKSLEETTNGLSAAMGEMEEKLDRALARVAGS